MSEKNFPLTKAQLQEIIKEYPTPFHIYDEHAIRQNIRALLGSARSLNMSDTVRKLSVLAAASRSCALFFSP